MSEEMNHSTTNLSERPTWQEKKVGGGTPLRDSEDGETPLYVSEKKLSPVVGVGPGTPLKEAETETKAEAEVKPKLEPKAEPKAENKPKESAPVAKPAAAAPAEEAPKEIVENEGVEEEAGDFGQELDKLLESEPLPGEVIRGKVIRIDEEGVVVDIGSKSEGIISRQEFLTAKGDFVTKIGDEVEVLLERRENREGLLVLSKTKVDKRKGWNQAKAALANNSSMEGTIYDKCKGGFMVDLGSVQAFLPASQLDLGPVKNPEEYFNKKQYFKIIKLNRERGNIVVSRRNYLLDERDKKRTDVVAKLTLGRLVHGVVRNITNFGAFLDIGGVDALLHVNDMSWSKVNNPRHYVNLGDELEVLVLAIDQQTGKIAVGLKQKSQDPWLNITEKYPKDSLVEGEVVSLTDFGVFLRLEEGVEGLLPISEMSWTRRVRHPKELVKVGDSLRVKVLNIDAAAKKISLGLKQTEKDPFILFVENHKAGDVVLGEVKTLARYGAFIELTDGVTGLLHVSDLSWNGAVKQPGDILKTGDKLEVKLLEIQIENKKIALGLKQLGEDPWVSAAKRYPVGAMVKAKVIRNTKFGVFVELEPGIEGLVHVSQLEREKGKTEFAALPEGQIVDAKVVKVNWPEHKIGLSIRDAAQAQENAEIQKYLSPTHKPGFSLGEASGVNMEELLKKFQVKSEG